MRTWRVGTISMGMTLIFLGSILVLSQLFDWKPAYAMMGWWPLILIVLGVEILIYLWLSKKENPVVKYDIVSILFVGIIGFIGIGFVAVSTTGILDKLYDWTNYEVKTIDLPPYSIMLDDTIKRVVVDAGSEPLTIETGETNEVAVFGTYIADVVNGEHPIKTNDDYLYTEQKGDTLYMEFKIQPQTFNPFDHTHERSAKLILPSYVQVEIEANHQLLHVNSRMLRNDWTIENAMGVHVKLASDLDVLLNAENVEHIQNKDNIWKEKDVNNEEIYDTHSGSLTLGEGTHAINILNSTNLSVTMNK